MERARQAARVRSAVLSLPKGLLTSKYQGVPTSGGVESIHKKEIMLISLTEIEFDANGLIPAIVQDAETKEVLMLAYVNQESLRLTLKTGETHFWSRSRKELWHKGGTSGNIQKIVEVRVDCDADTLLIRVHPAGPACHTGERSCFYRKI